MIQRRINGSINFHRGWKEYENGFGPIDGEHWIGTYIFIVSIITKSNKFLI